jgi:hypothetical protein
MFTRTLLPWEGNAFLFSMLTYICGCQQCDQHWKPSHGSTAVGFYIVALHTSLPTWNPHLPVKFPIFWYEFNQIRGFSTDSCRSPPVTIVTEFRPMRDAMMHAAREMNKHDEAKSRFAREHDPCKRLHDVRKSRLRNTKKPIILLIDNFSSYI